MNSQTKLHWSFITLLIRLADGHLSSYTTKITQTTHTMQCLLTSICNSKNTHRLFCSLVDKSSSISYINIFTLSEEGFFHSFGFRVSWGSEGSAGRSAAGWGWSWGSGRCRFPRDCGSDEGRYSRHYSSTPASSLHCSCETCHRTTYKRMTSL